MTKQDMKNMQPDRYGLVQCPHDKATRCCMDEECKGCEVYAELELHAKDIQAELEFKD